MNFDSRGGGSMDLPYSSESILRHSETGMSEDISLTIRSPTDSTIEEEEEGASGHSGSIISHQNPPLTSRTEGMQQLDTLYTRFLQKSVKKAGHPDKKKYRMNLSCHLTIRELDDFRKSQRLPAESVYGITEDLDSLHTKDTCQFHPDGISQVYKRKKKREVWCLVIVACILMSLLGCVTIILVFYVTK